MNTTSWVLVGLAVIFAFANWWARANEDRRLEYVTKPAVTAVVLAAAVALDPAHPAMRDWFVAGFAFCLVGDVLLMLPKEQFVGGLAALFAAHAPLRRGLLRARPPGGPAAPGRRRRGAGGRVDDRPHDRGGGQPDAARPLGVAVALYMLVISAMVVAAFATARKGWGVVGVSAFFASDAMLGFDRFVGRLTGAPVAIMASYHLALLGLLLSLP